MNQMKIPLKLYKIENFEVELFNQVFLKTSWKKFLKLMSFLIASCWIVFDLTQRKLEIMCKFLGEF